MKHLEGCNKIYSLLETSRSYKRVPFIDNNRYQQYLIKLYNDRYNINQNPVKVRVALNTMLWKCIKLISQDSYVLLFIAFWAFKYIIMTRKNTLCWKYNKYMVGLGNKDQQDVKKQKQHCIVLTRQTW